MTRGRGFFALVVAVVLLCVGTSAAAPEFDPSRHVTISRIEPIADDRAVRLTFSAPVDRNVLTGVLQTFPSVRLNWHQARVDGDGVLTLPGEFSGQRRYTVSLPTGARLNFGSTLTYFPTQTSFTMPGLSTILTFAQEKRVVERDSRQMIALRVRNVSRFALESLAVPPLLLPHVLNMDLTSGAEGWGEARAVIEKELPRVRALAQGDPRLAPFLGEARAERQLLSDSGQPNLEAPLTVSLASRKESGKGALLLLALSPFQDSDRTGADGWSSRRLINVTDIGLTYKLSQEGLLVWATSLATGKPMAGVSLLAFDVARNMAPVPLGNTGADGTLRFSLKERSLTPTTVAYLMAATADDVSFLEVKPQGDFTPPGVRTGKGAAALPAKGHLLTERGIYRPGEKVHFKGTVRQYAEGRISPPAGRRVAFSIVSSKGEQVFSREETLSEFGTAAGETVIKPHLPLGTYTLAMRFGSTQSDTVSRTFQVQEFVAPRHFSEVSFARSRKVDPSFVNRAVTRETLRVTLAGRYYAGGPVKDGRVRWRINRAQTEQSVAGWEAWKFGNPMGDNEQGELLESGESVLDAKGELTIEFPLDRELAAGEKGLLVSATVVDFDGRAATEKKLYQADPPVLVGLKAPPAGQVRMGEEQAVEVAVLDRAGKPVRTGKVTVETQRQDHNWIQKRNAEGDLYWTYELVWRRMGSASLPLREGRGSFTYLLPWWGDFRVVFTWQDEGGRTASSSLRHQLDYDYDEEGGVQGGNRPYLPLPLTCDKNSYRPGENAVLRVNPRQPVSAYLVTVERDRVLEHRVIPVEPGTRTITLPIRGSFTPNAYVSVVGIIPRGEFPLYDAQADDETPAYLFGMLNLQVSPEGGEISVSIGPENAKLRGLPGESKKVELRARDQKGAGIKAELAVAVVDERVLALTGYVTPTLDSLLQMEGPLGVVTGELRSRLAPQTPFGRVRNEPLSGGDGMGKDASAASSKVRRDFNPVAFFDPAVRTDDKGLATVTFTLPDTMTTYRVFAVACDRGSRFGSAAEPLLVVKPFYLEPGLPRFFTRGDDFRFLVSAFNTTPAPDTMGLGVTSTPPLSLRAEQGSVAIPAQDSARLKVAGKAVSAGEAKVTVSGMLGTVRDTVEMKIPVRSGFTLGTESATGQVQGSARLGLSLPDAVRGIDTPEEGLDEVRCLLTLSSSPFLRMRGGLRYLLHYPYGCVEQTSSGVLPLAALRKLITEGQLPGITVEETDQFLSKGVERLLGMQNEAGGFGYWPGDRMIHPWGSIYAGCALSIARQAGYEVPADRMKMLTDYLKKGLTGLSPGGQDAGWASFACYILALNRDLSPGDWQNASRVVVDREGKLLLQLAGVEQGLFRWEAAAGPVKELIGQRFDPNRWMAFYAVHREPAIALLAAAATLPWDPVTGGLAKELMGAVGPDGTWVSTSSTGWALFALGKYFAASSFASEEVVATVRQPGKEPRKVAVPPGQFGTLELDRAAFLGEPSVEVEVPGGKTLIYELAATAPRPDWAAKGHTAGFAVEKTIRNTDGGGEIRVGDLVEVNLVIRPPARRVEYLVVDDPLPAGLVAVNSAIANEEPVDTRERSDAYEYYWISDHAYRLVPNFTEMRDDRVLLFRNELWSWWGDHEYRYSYIARAVCEGTFIVPSTKAQLMYSPEVVGLTPRTVLVIKGRE